MKARRTRNAGPRHYYLSIRSHIDIVRRELQFEISLVAEIRRVFRFRDFFGQYEMDIVESYVRAPAFAVRRHERFMSFQHSAIFCFFVKRHTDSYSFTRTNLFDGNRKIQISAYSAKVLGIQFYFPVRFASVEIYIRARIVVCVEYNSLKFDRVGVLKFFFVYNTLLTHIIQNMRKG